MKHKILIIVNEFQNLINFRLPLIRFLKEKHINIQIICYSKKNKEKNQYDELLNVPVHYLSGESKGINLLKEIFYFTKLFFLVTKLNPSLIMSFTIKPNIYSAIISKIQKRKNIISITGLGSTYIEKGIFNRIIMGLFKFFKNPNIIYVFQNQDDAKVFKDYYIINKFNNFIIPGSGVDLKMYSKNTDYIKKNDYLNFNFLFIGRLIKHKGIEEFYKAALKLLSNSKLNINFTIIGKFNSSDRYSITHKLYKEISKNSNFELISFTDQISKFILKSNCVLLTSMREGMPMSLLEASAIGRPIIASNVPGCKEIVVDNFNGFKYKSGDYDDLFKKMNILVNLPNEKILRFCDNAHIHVSNKFSSKIINDKYYKVIKNLL